MLIGYPDLQSEIRRLRSRLAHARVQSSFLSVNHAIAEREPFYFVSAVNNRPTLVVGEDQIERRNATATFIARVGRTPGGAWQ